MYLLIFPLQLTLLVPLLIGFFAVTLAASFIKRQKDDSDDDLGYLENIVSEKGGLDYEEGF